VSAALSIEEQRAQLAGASCVVTGGAGFIGRHLVERLLACGAQRVRVLDRATAIAAWQPPRVGTREPELVAVDLAEARQLAPLLRGCDLLFHLAAEKHARARLDPELALRVNVLGTERLLRAAAASAVGKVVFSSSLLAHGGAGTASAASVSGDAGGAALGERDPPAPESIYGISKLAGEQLLRCHAREHGLRATALRLFFIYGPRQDEGPHGPSLIVKSCQRILRGEPPLICGDGRQALDYLYVDDAIDALVLATRREADGELFHIGSGRAVPVAELVRALLAVAGSALRPVHVPADETAGTWRAADIAHARERLGWRPRTPLEQGLRLTLDWVRARDARACNPQTLGAAGS
jgi:UDP-glucose 4-epimerase